MPGSKKKMVANVGSAGGACGLSVPVKAAAPALRIYREVQMVPVANGYILEFIKFRRDMRDGRDIMVARNLKELTELCSKHLKVDADRGGQTGPECEETTAKDKCHG